MEVFNTLIFSGWRGVHLSPCFDLEIMNFFCNCLISQKNSCFTIRIYGVLLRLWFMPLLASLGTQSIIIRSGAGMF